MKTSELFEQRGQLFYAYVTSRENDSYAWYIVNTTNEEHAYELISSTVNQFTPREEKIFRRQQIALKRQGSEFAEQEPLEYDIDIYDAQGAAEMTYGEYGKAMQGLEDPGFGNIYEFNSGS